MDCSECGRHLYRAPCVRAPCNKLLCEDCLAWPAEDRCPRECLCRAEGCAYLVVVEEREAA